MLPKIRIMFVCHGNICRSPMAEFIMKDLVKKQGIEYKFEIASSATSTEEIWNGIGNPVYPPAKAELERHELSCGGKRAVQLQSMDLNVTARGRFSFRKTTTASMICLSVWTVQT